MYIPGELLMFHWTSFIVAIIGIQYLCLAVLQVFFSGSDFAAKVFRSSREFANNSEYKVMLANVGIYNFCLSVGLLWSVWRLDSYEQLFFLGFAFVASMFGSITMKQKFIFWTQALPALIGIFLILVFAGTGFIQDLL